jgi:hypothetical protein
MSSGVRKKYRGSFVGTGAQLDITVVGFRPREVTLQNVGAGLSSANWQESMPDGAMTKEITAGTMSYVTGGNGITPLVNGFRLGADVNLNIAGQTVLFTCEE